MVSARYDARFECLQGYGKKEQRESLLTQGEEVLVKKTYPSDTEYDCNVCCFLLIVTWLWSVSLFNTNDLLLLKDDCPNDHIGLQSKCSILGSDGKMPWKVEHSAIWCFEYGGGGRVEETFFQETYVWLQLLQDTFGTVVSSPGVSK